MAAATKTKPAPEAPAVDSPAVVAARERYAAACEAEKAQPSKDAARATDAAATALYRALRAVPA